MFRNYTFVKSAPITVSIGNDTDTTNASFQLTTKPTTNPDMKVVKYCKNAATLSPIPECIFSTSLSKRNITKSVTRKEVQTLYYNNLSQLSSGSDFFYLASLILLETLHLFLILMSIM